MPKKENQHSIWKTAALCALCTLGIYLALQFLSALLVARESVGEGKAAFLIWISAGISAAAGVLIMGRKCRTGRLILGVGCFGIFAAILLLCTLTAGEMAAETWTQFAGTAGSASAGSLLVAVAAGPRKGRKKAKRR